MGNLVSTDDLLKDDFGNYYLITASHKNGDQVTLTLVNAYMHYAYSPETTLTEEFKYEMADYYGHPLGQIPMDKLQAQIERLSLPDGPGTIHRLSDLTGDYHLVFTSPADSWVAK